MGMFGYLMEYVLKCYKGNGLSSSIRRRPIVHMDVKLITRLKVVN